MKDRLVYINTSLLLWRKIKMRKKYIEPEELAEVKKLDLLTYLSNYEPNELVMYSKNDFGTKTHSSLHISNGLWTWWAKGIGGKSALDYLIKVEEMNFLDAALLIHECIKANPPIEVKRNVLKNIRGSFRLPYRNDRALKLYDYLVNRRHIDKEVVDFYYLNHTIYETTKDHAVIFVGYDDRGVARFGSKRATEGMDKRNIYGSDKRYSFRLANTQSDDLHVFESPIDLMSFQTLEKMNNREWKHQNYLSIDGATLIGKTVEDTEIPVALEHFLKRNTQITNIILHLDNDKAGYDTLEKIKYHLSDKYEITDKSPKGCKDVNEVLTLKVLSRQSALTR